MCINCVLIQKVADFLIQGKIGERSRINNLVSGDLFLGNFASREWGTIIMKLRGEFIGFLSVYQYQLIINLSI